MATHPVSLFEELLDRRAWRGYNHGVTKSYWDKGKHMAMGFWNHPARSGLVSLEEGSILMSSQPGGGDSELRPWATAWGLWQRHSCVGLPPGALFFQSPHGQ